MSSYSSEPWQESSKSLRKDNTFSRSSEAAFFEQQELAYVNKDQQNGAGGSHTQFGASRCVA